MRMQKKNRKLKRILIGFAIWVILNVSVYYFLEIYSATHNIRFGEEVTAVNVVVGDERIDFEFFEDKYYIDTSFTQNERLQTAFYCASPTPLKLAIGILSRLADEFLTSK